MKLFETSRGFIFSFGFDVIKRKKDPRVIMWSDPVTKEWETKKDNLAGYINAPCPVYPQFIHETRSGIVAYRPGLCIEMDFIGPPLMWSFTILAAEADFSIIKAA